MSSYSSTAAMMKYISALFAVLAIIGLGQAYPSPDFGSGLQERSLQEELLDFLKLFPVDKVQGIVLKYVYADKKIQEALLYLLTSDFHSLMRDIEDLKEFKALVIYLENTGLPVIKALQLLHKFIGMEDYEPPEALLKSLFKTQRIGDGMKGMIEDIYNALPMEKIKALYNEKLQNSRVFSEFVRKIKSPQMQKLIDDLYAHPTFKNWVTKTRQKGLEFQALTKLIATIFGLNFPY